MQTQAPFLEDIKRLVNTLEKLSTFSDDAVEQEILFWVVFELFGFKQILTDSGGVCFSAEFRQMLINSFLIHKNCASLFSYDLKHNLKLLLVFTICESGFFQFADDKLDEVLDSLLRSFPNLCLQQEKARLQPVDPNCDIEKLASLVNQELNNCEQATLRRLNVFKRVAEQRGTTDVHADIPVDENLVADNKEQFQMFFRCKLSLIQLHEEFWKSLAHYAQNLDPSLCKGNPYFLNDEALLERRLAFVSQIANSMSQKNLFSQVQQMIDTIEKYGKKLQPVKAQLLGDKENLNDLKKQLGMQEEAVEQIVEITSSLLKGSDGTDCTESVAQALKFQLLATIVQNQQTESQDFDLSQLDSWKRDSEVGLAAGRSQFESFVDKFVNSLSGIGGVAFN